MHAQEHKPHDTATVLMSIKPIYWERILSGSKLFELRRRAPKVQAGDLVLVYASAPSKALTGAFRVSRLLFGSPERLWSLHGRAFGIARDAYLAYFAGAEQAWAIEVARPMAIESVPLAELRRSFPGFRPPQSYMYWSSDRLRTLTATAPFSGCTRPSAA